MRDLVLISYSAAAVELDVTRFTIADLVKKLGIESKVIPTNGNAKGLNAADMRLLRRALGLSKRRRESIPA